MDKTIFAIDNCREYISQQLLNQTTNNNTVGVELELFPYKKSGHENNKLSPVFLNDKDESIAKMLYKVSKNFGGIATFRNPVPSRKNATTFYDKIEFSNNNQILFEPGGQVEIRTTPCQSVDDLENHILFTQQVLNDTSKKNQFSFGQAGLNPIKNLLSRGTQIQQPRYIALEKYLDNIGPYGRQMMLQTCSMHINLDLSNDKTIQAKRVVAANLLVPFVTALFANSPFKTKQGSDYKSYRSFVWQQLDNTRTGILPIHKLENFLTHKHVVDLYLSMALHAPLIYIPELGEKILPAHLNMKYWLTNPINGISPQKRHFENHLSLLYPEVRLKGYLELRTVDSPPVNWQLVPIVFYLGLLYNNLQLDKSLSLLFPLSHKINSLFQQSPFGFESDEIFIVAKKLMQLSIDGASNLPERLINKKHINQLIDYFEKYTSQRKSFSDNY